MKRNFPKGKTFETRAQRGAQAPGLELCTQSSSVKLTNLNRLWPWDATALYDLYWLSTCNRGESTPLIVNDSYRRKTHLNGYCRGSFTESSEPGNSDFRVHGSLFLESVGEGRRQQLPADPIHFILPWLQPLSRSFSKQRAA